jgi:hypothetical protein
MGQLHASMMVALKSHWTVVSCCAKTEVEQTSHPMTRKPAAFVMECFIVVAFMLG